MKKCPKCGAVFAEDEVRYCTFCGAPVEEVIAQTTDNGQQTTEETEADNKKESFEQKAKEVADELKETAEKIGAAARETAEKLNDKYGDKAREELGKAKEGFEKVMDTPDSTDQYDPADIENNKILALFSYIGILFIVPLLAAKDSKYARFHANQGLILFICMLICSFFAKQHIIGWAFCILSALCVVLAILGIINAVTGKAKELPGIGKFRIIK